MYWFGFGPCVPYVGILSSRYYRSLACRLRRVVFNRRHHVGNTTIESRTSEVSADLGRELRAMSLSVVCTSIYRPKVTRRRTQYNHSLVSHDMVIVCTTHVSVDL